jgi:hypothetical protein
MVNEPKRMRCHECRDEWDAEQVDEACPACDSEAVEARGSVRGKDEGGRYMANHKYEVAQRVWYLRSVRLCEVVELHDGGTYTVEVMDSGWRFEAREEELGLFN